MSDTNDGGPAFPLTPCPGCDNSHKSVHEFSGMTIRDYFAAKALAGMLSDPDSGGQPKIFAECAYAHADAMLVARKAVPK